MPSPFPGMDPFLEAPTGWHGFHTRLLTTISDELADRLAPAFIVQIEERVYITAPDDPLKQTIVPDVYMVTGRGTTAATEPAGQITTPTLVEPLTEIEIHDRYLEIHDAETREVITTIEILSPFNKAAGTQGREAFLRKRHAVMHTRAHWIEIDLLRGGERPPEVAGQSDYYALLKRGDVTRPFEVWYVDLRDRLPTIAVPLRGTLPDVPLDLQAMVEIVYRRGHYAESLDYTRRVPPPPLKPADQAWVEEQIRRWQTGVA